MSTLSKEPYRGTRDFAPRDMFLQTYIFSVWREVCQSFGYEEYMTPTVEPLELYTAKTSEEIVSQQTYSFEDRGGRTIAIRPEMTPSVARLVAQQRQESGYPLRLFSIPNCMRYERPQKGRLREFWQLNADIFGDASLDAEFEMLKLTDGIMKAFGADESMYEIRINSRKLLAKRIKQSGLKTTTEAVVRIVDEYEKLDRQEVVKKLQEHLKEPESFLIKLEKDGPSDEVKILKKRCEEAGITLVTKETIARGFDYYTDIVFEVFDKNPENNRSMFGGGRYDNLVGLFGVDPLPTVGFGMGDATLLEFLKGHDLLPEYMPATELMLASVGDVNDASLQKLAAQLREFGVNVATDFSGSKADKKIKNTVKLGIPFMVFVGEEELKSKQFGLKQLDDKSETACSLEQIPLLIEKFFEDDEEDYDLS